MTQLDIGRNKKARTANSTYPKGGGSCFADGFVVAKSSVLRMKFGVKNPALRVAANRWWQLFQTRNSYKKSEIETFEC